MTCIQISFLLAVHVSPMLQVPEAQHFPLEHVAEALTHCESSQQGRSSAMFVTTAVNEVHNNNTLCNAIHNLNLFEIHNLKLSIHLFES
jgi:hypothetical protein